MNNSTSLDSVRLRYKAVRLVQKQQARELNIVYQRLCVAMMIAHDKEGHSYQKISEEAGGYNRHDVSNMAEYARNMIEAGHWRM